jgi:hypothetical protein
VDLVEAKFDRWALLFDGHVLEFFGGSVSAWRRHAGLLDAVVVTGPDKRGDYSVAIQPPPDLTTAFKVAEAEYEEFQRVISALQTAGVPVSVSP